MIDATFGEGGHARALAERVGRMGTIIGIDRDPEAIERAREQLNTFPSHLFLLHGNFQDLKALLADAPHGSPAGVLFDFGVLSRQLDEAGRGFSFRREGPLDMRQDTTQAMTAADLVNGAPVEELERIIREYGEERFSRRIANAIAERRETTPFSTTLELRDTVHQAIPRRLHPRDIDAATRTFQAIRIAVNDELSAISTALADTLELLKPGGRLCAISYHSLEDRIVKTTLKRAAGQCICPPGLPACQCGARKAVELLNKRPIMAGEEETRSNPRSRSAKLRAVRKLS